MRRLFQLLATLVVLLGMLPCELREALPVLGEVVSACCDDDRDDATEDLDDADCCQTAACRVAASITAPLARVEKLDAYLLLDEPQHLEPQTRGAGPPPSPPPIA